MHDFATKVLWIYIILLLVGGLIGFFKGKSKVSLITSAVFAALLVLTVAPGVFQPGFARGLANVIMAVLLVVFAVRLAKTKKFMPSGLMLVVTIAALALQNLFKG
ncbi:MAG TPA: TMEM14 family protein [Verrucomicrobiae bacterium]|nr:TMEM14 family protein [Verrucomicrobiae bacterium]